MPASRNHYITIGKSYIIHAFLNLQIDYESSSFYEKEKDEPWLSEIKNSVW